MLEQLRFLVCDYTRLLGKKKVRIIHIWLSRVGIALLIYRLERGLYLLLGRFWEILRVLFLPILYPLYAYSNCEIHYKSAIEGGLLILHPSVGIVVSGKTIAGKNLTLTGGNVIGIDPGSGSGNIILGNNCTLGANAVVIGPLTLGHDVTIGASAMVNKGAPDGAILVGVPAKNIRPIP